MHILIRKISDDRHTVEIERVDGTSDRVELDSRSFLRHDLAHYAVELEIPIYRGYWGSVCAGASLASDEIAGPDAMLAERLAGPVQTLMRVDADVGEYFTTLERVIPDLASTSLAERLHERIRQLRGLWKSTHYSESMKLEWPERQDAAPTTLFATSSPHYKFS